MEKNIYTDEKHIGMKNDMQKNLWDEYKEYISGTALTGYERRLLHKWVSEGHSVYETVESRYMPGESYPPMDFIDAYRFDRSMAKEMAGMSSDEKEAYLKAFMGYEDASPESAAMEAARRGAPKIIHDHVRKLEREIFYLWNFIWQEGLGEDAREFLDEHMDEEIPFEW